MVLVSSRSDCYRSIALNLSHIKLLFGYISLLKKKANQAKFLNIKIVR